VNLAFICFHVATFISLLPNN